MVSVKVTFLYENDFSTNISQINCWFWFSIPPKLVDTFGTKSKLTDSRKVWFQGFQVKLYFIDDDLMFLVYVLHSDRTLVRSSPSCAQSNRRYQGPRWLTQGVLMKDHMQIFLIYEFFWLYLTYHALCISESCIKIKINLNFYFHTSLWCLKWFYEGLLGLHKTFKDTKKKCENKILSYFSLFSTGIATGRVNYYGYHGVQKHPWTATSEG